MKKDDKFLYNKEDENLKDDDFSDLLYDSKELKPNLEEKRKIDKKKGTHEFTVNPTIKLNSFEIDDAKSKSKDVLKDDDTFEFEDDDFLHSKEIRKYSSIASKYSSLISSDNVDSSKIKDLEKKEKEKLRIENIRQRILENKAKKNFDTSLRKEDKKELGKPDRNYNDSSTVSEKIKEIGNLSPTRGLLNKHPNLEPEEVDEKITSPEKNVNLNSGRIQESKERYDETFEDKLYVENTLEEDVSHGEIFSSYENKIKSKRGIWKREDVHNINNFSGAPSKREDSLRNHEEIRFNKNYKFEDFKEPEIERKKDLFEEFKIVNENIDFFNLKNLTTEANVKAIFEGNKTVEKEMSFEKKDNYDETRLYDSININKSIRNNEVKGEITLEERLSNHTSEFSKPKENNIGIKLGEQVENKRDINQHEIINSDNRIEKFKSKEIVNEVTIEEEVIKEGEWCNLYNVPTSRLLYSLNNSSNFNSNIDHNLQIEEANFKTQKINSLFSNFGVSAQVSGFQIGPTVTTYEVSIDPGIRISKITNLEDNIKLTLEAKDIRIQAPIPGRSFVGIEVPNSTKKIVTFYETLKQNNLEENLDGELNIILGQDVFGNKLNFDLAKAPHALVAGATGSGKSVAINVILSSILMQYSPKDVKLLLIDPKMVEFTNFLDIPHLITSVVTNSKDANSALKIVVTEMDARYLKMSKIGARNIIEYNNKVSISEKIPYIVVVIDELADLMMVSAKEVEDSIMRITQKARAAGIHMIVSTQRPSTDVITGLIKSNIPTRIAFSVASSIDSRTILDSIGAEKLIGNGDMLISLYGKKPIRGQSSYITYDELSKICDFSKKQCKPNYDLEIKAEDNFTTEHNSFILEENDPIYKAAKRIVIQQKKASISMIQRYLNAGYNKAANIIESLEYYNVVGPQNGSKPREILVSEDLDNN